MAEKNKDIQTETKESAARQFEIAVLPLQNTTMFPDTVVPLSVGRARSVKAVEAALSTEEKLIACVTIKTSEITGSDAKPVDLYEVGTIVNIKRMMRNDDVMQLIVQGVDRVKILYWAQEEPFLRAKVEILPELKVTDREEVEALKRNIHGMIQEALTMLPQVPPEVRMAVVSQNDPVQLSYFLASVLELGNETEQKMLEANTADELLTLTHAALSRELEIMQIRSKIA
ncbi:MAG TPA: LON peptidase substrate-binding domain-containing protein, partial [Pyrinomonadaceae bacterium]